MKSRGLAPLLNYFLLGFCASLFAFYRCSTFAEDDYFPLRAGNQWVMKVTYTSPSGQVSLGAKYERIEGPVEKDGVTYFRRHSRTQGLPLTIEDSHLERKDEKGLYYIDEHGISSEGIIVEFPLKGDSKPQKDDELLNTPPYTTIDFEAIELAGKLYENCWHTVREEGGGAKRETWEAPNVGLVKSIVTYANGANLTEILKEFKPAPILTEEKETPPVDQFPNSTPPELLSKGAHAKFQKHAAAFYDAATQIAADLQFSAEDERVLSHLPKRGFRYLVALIRHDGLYTYARSSLFSTEQTLKSCSREEGVAGELLGMAIASRLLANRNACFHLLKELAPTPEAMKYEEQAKELNEKMDITTESSYLQSLERIRALFDKLKDLPRLSPEEFANERAESAVLPRQEYEEMTSRAESGSEWAKAELKWHQKWNRNGYILAFSEFLGPRDYEQFKIVVKQRGGIFEWNKLFSGSHFHPDSYESRLKEVEFHALEAFLAKIPGSDATNKDAHFVMSFLKDGQWTTRVYTALPPGSPFEELIERMVRQSNIERGDEYPLGDGYLQIYPERK